MIDRESKSAKRKRCHSATASAIASTLIALISKLGLGSHKPEINRLKYDSASDYETEKKEPLQQDSVNEHTLTRTGIYA
jgi:hypothetical protein